MSADPAGGGSIAAPRDDLCLDFVNTRSWRGLPEPSEELREFADVAAWARAKGGFDAGAAAIVAAWPAHRAGPGEFAAALALREALFRIFAAAAAAGSPDPADLDLFNRHLATAAPRVRMVRDAAAFAWAVAGLRPGLAALLSPVLWSAADLLAGPRRDRVRLCGNPQCLWLFLDDSKSGNRRWCSMASCGNRAKAHRHYLKRRGREEG